jgi:hypothetical protein
MRAPSRSRSRSLALVLTGAVVIVTGCARCGSRPPPPVERFIAADAAAALVVPTLQGLAQQVGDLVATAGTFPFGAAVRDGRSVIAGRLTFDPLDAKAIAAAGLDPQRGFALSGKVGARGPDSPDVVLSLPVGDPAKLEVTIATIAKDRLGASERAVDPGTPEVIAWRAAGGEIAFAYAVVERTAIFSSGEGAVAAVRAAAAVPATATLASLPAYQQATKALGDGLAARFFVPAGSPALQGMPQFENGVAFALRGASDRFGLSVAMPLGAREAPIKAALATGTSGALLGQLDPSAVLVVRGDGASGSSAEPGVLAAALAAQGIPPPIGELVGQFAAAVGGSSAMALSVLPQKGKPAALQSEPLRLFGAELLVAVKDPVKLTGAIQGAVDALGAQLTGGKGKLALGRNPWRFPIGGGEVAATVKDGKLAVVLGPPRALEALLARTGSTFKGPTPASDRALKSATGGMFLDVPRLVAGVMTLPEASWGPGQQGVMVKSMVDQWATAAARISAVSLATDLVEGFARGELLVEVAPASPRP